MVIESSAHHLGLVRGHVALALVGIVIARFALQGIREIVSDIRCEFHLVAIAHLFAVATIFVMGIGAIGASFLYWPN